ncbi:hypothetical protein ACFQ3P_34525 [Paraburkholderia sabiae]|uniref:Uncharacterized protein n=1 Tax=Paraburkholderia sabiae TaxID=273251 RepID=A0ABU9QL78_9BURK|nr:hypothetical protein [Paraburkholderia sabiae]WJZ79294.1 hypothetical protein QEN71_41405 [Paraburkholderia sabiae]CAD6560831.1 hypothetical protein LMG24235_07101 [Paraburkholderia sabiae]
MIFQRTFVVGGLAIPTVFLFIQDAFAQSEASQNIESDLIPEAQRKNRRAKRNTGACQAETAHPG